VTPEGEGLQDSTPVIERFEAAQPSLAPADKALDFISALLEEYGDEWGNKWMFHYRWRYQPDVWSTAERIARQMMEAEGTLAVAQARTAVAERMMGRIGFVGSNPRTEPTIEASFRNVLALLEAHLQARPYMLGGRPAMADFGLWGQLYEAASDPTPGAIMRASSPKVMAWVQRMLTPKDEGPFEAWPALAPTLMPILKEELAGLFLPWSTANAAAIARQEKSFEMTLAGAPWSQEPQKYHARSLAEIRRKYAAAKGAPGLEAMLSESGCLKYLA
jgi:glutathione S-transferase